MLSAVTAGLFMLFNIPFWVLATRSLPGTFHLLMLMVAVWFFSEYQRTGKTGWLYSLGLLWGVGITEFPTFLIFTPLAVVLVVRAMLQRAEFSWPVLIRAGLLTLVGLCLYLVNAWSLWADPVVRLRGFGSVGSVLWYIWRDQWHLIVAGPFILVTVLVAFPWGVIFLVPRKKPAWRYTAWQVLLRLAVLVLGLLALFYLDVFTILAKLKPGLVKDLPPLGLFFPLATPHLILAGYSPWWSAGPLGNNNFGLALTGGGLAYAPAEDPGSKPSSAYGAIVNTSLYVLAQFGWTVD